MIHLGADFVKSSPASSFVLSRSPQCGARATRAILLSFGADERCTRGAAILAISGSPESRRLSSITPDLPRFFELIGGDAARLMTVLARPSARYAFLLQHRRFSALVSRQDAGDDDKHRHNTIIAARKTRHFHAALGGDGVNH
jgi:hypothetical protein